MRIRTTLIAPLLLLTLPLIGQAQAPSSPWPSITLLDLQGIHDTLRDNHPGPVDPENSRYAKWLEEGLRRATEQAKSVRSYSEYTRVLRYYANGFQDGHLGVDFGIIPREVRWPGFVVGPDDQGAAQVTYADTDAGVKVGDHVLSCDGRSIDDLMKERVDPYYWNSAIPHQRPAWLHYLFHIDPNDTPFRLNSCRLTSGEVNLTWKRTERAAFQKILDTALGRTARELALEQADGVWLIKIPTLAFTSDASVKKVRDFLTALTTKSTELRQSTIVVDVRGNHGGDSSWGQEIAAVLWNRAWVKYVVDSFDQTVDWRASPANLKWIEYLVDRQRKAGLKDSANYLTHVAEKMKAASASGKALARTDEPPRPKPKPAENPVTGHVYFLTDNECASACLDFADLMRRLPGVTHIGLPTSADAIYIDNTTADLPSGLGLLGYSLKVYRHRVRGNNEWYEPQVRWPGGPMTDEAIVNWVKTLAR